MRPARVHEALASVCSETYPDIEIVVVDDGGSFVAPDDKVQIVRGAGLGVGAARNLGLAAATGEYVIFLDDDDIALPHRIDRLVSVARDRHATICFGMTRRVVEGTAEVLGDVPTHIASPGPIGFCDLLTCAPHVNAVLARTDALRAVGGFDTSAEHFDDWSAWLRLADRDESMWCIPDAVAEWRIHGNGLSANVLQRSAMKSRLVALFERLLPSLSHKNARAVAAALEVVQSAEIVTYDDYVGSMAVARDVLHVAGTYDR